MGAEEEPAVEDDEHGGEPGKRVEALNGSIPWRWLGSGTGRTGSGVSIAFREIVSAGRK